MFLAAVPEIQELYKNLESILGELKLETLDWTGSSDIKMVLILLGKDQASCRHSCPFCESKAPWTTPGKLNTLGSLRAWHEKWIASGSDPKEKKNHQNMGNPPIVEGEDEDKILELFVPMELHLLLGIIEKLLHELKRNVFPSLSDGKKFMTTFFKDNSITVGVKQGGKLDGNACRDFLNAIDNLERAFQDHSVEVFLKGLPYIEALRKFNKVREKAFGMDLEEGWVEAIREFEISYRGLRNKANKPISVTPKVN